MNINTAFRISTVAIAMVVALAIASAMTTDPVRIMFDPATDGPITVEKRSAAGPTVLGCLTMMSIDNGRSGVPVYTPCTTTVGTR